MERRGFLASVAALAVWPVGRLFGSTAPVGAKPPKGAARTLKVVSGPTRYYFMGWSGDRSIVSWVTVEFRGEPNRDMTDAVLAMLPVNPGFMRCSVDTDIREGRGGPGSGVLTMIATDRADHRFD